MTQSIHNPDTPRSIQPRVSTQRVGSETLVYDPGRHMAFCLNRSSSVVWSLANGERTVAEIGRAASLELGTSASEEFVFFALDRLRADGLIEPAPTAAPRPVISRRTMLRRLGAGSTLLLPVVAAIVAPTAAQAYSGCVDCSASTSRSTQQAARAKRQSLGGPGELSPFSTSGSLGPSSPYTTPSIAQPANQPAKPHP